MTHFNVIREKEEEEEGRPPKINQHPPTTTQYSVIIFQIQSYPKSMEIKPISTQTHPKPNSKSTQNKINSKQNPIENPFKNKI